MILKKFQLYFRHVFATHLILDSYIMNVACRSCKDRSVRASALMRSRNVVLLFIRDVLLISSDLFPVRVAVTILALAAGCAALPSYKGAPRLPQLARGHSFSFQSSSAAASSASSSSSFSSSGVNFKNAAPSSASSAASSSSSSFSG